MSQWRGSRRRGSRRRARRVPNSGLQHARGELRDDRAEAADGDDEEDRRHLRRRRGGRGRVRRRGDREERDRAAIATSPPIRRPRPSSRGSTAASVSARVGDTRDARRLGGEHREQRDRDAPGEHPRSREPSRRRRRSRPARSRGARAHRASACAELHARPDAGRRAERARRSSPPTRSSGGPGPASPRSLAADRSPARAAGRRAPSCRRRRTARRRCPIPAKDAATAISRVRPAWSSGDSAFPRAVAGEDECTAAPRRCSREASKPGPARMPIASTRPAWPASARGLGIRQEDHGARPHGMARPRDADDGDRRGGSVEESVSRAPSRAG